MQPISINNPYDRCTAPWNPWSECKEDYDYDSISQSLIPQSHYRERRIWFVVDELRSLQKLPELETFVVEAREYGGCGIFSIQSPSQLFEIYGNAATETILGNCQTKIIFNENEPKTAKLISEFFGETEIEPKFRFLREAISIDF